MGGKRKEGGGRAFGDLMRETFRHKHTPPNMLYMDVNQPTTFLVSVPDTNQPQHGALPLRLGLGLRLPHSTNNGKNEVESLGEFAHGGS